MNTKDPNEIKHTLDESTQGTTPATAQRRSSLQERPERFHKFAVLSAVLLLFTIFQLASSQGWSISRRTETVDCTDETNPLVCFEPNRPAKASEANYNFKYLYERIEHLQATLEKKIGVVSETDVQLSGLIYDADGLVMLTNPTGTILPYAGSIETESLPEGYLLCDGTAVKQTQYPRLYEAIGNFWGKATADDEFLLPSLQGRFLRGFDPGPDPTLDRDQRFTFDKRVSDELVPLEMTQVGSYQGHALKSHRHASPSRESRDENFDTWGTSKRPTHPKSSGYRHYTDYVGESDFETRPVNAAVNFIIKY